MDGVDCLRLRIEVWGWGLKSEVEVWSLKFEWCWGLKFEVWVWGLKFEVWVRLRFEVWSLRLRFERLSLNLEFRFEVRVVNKRCRTCCLPVNTASHFQLSLFRRKRYRSRYLLLTSHSRRLLIILLTNSCRIRYRFVVLSCYYSVTK